MEEENIQFGGVLEGGITFQQMNPNQNIITITPAPNHDAQIQFVGANNQPVEVIINGNLLIDGNITVNGNIAAYDFIITNGGNLTLKNIETDNIKSSLKLNLLNNSVEFSGNIYTNPTALGVEIFKQMKKLREQMPINSASEFFEN